MSPSSAPDPHTFDRSLPSNPSYPHEFVEHLEDLLDNDPFGFIEFAAKVISSAEDPVGLAQHLIDESTREILALGLVMSELVMFPQAAPGVSAFPVWLDRLAEAELTRAAQRTEAKGGSTSYVMELVLAGGEIGTIQARVDHVRDDRISNVFVSATPLDETVRIIEAPTNLLPRTPYIAVDLEDAKGILQEALLAFKVDPLPQEAFNPWPANAPILDWVLSWHSLE